MNRKTDTAKTGTAVLLACASAEGLHFIAKGLEAEQFDVTGTTDAKLALLQLTQKRFDILMIDLMIPGINGLQLARKAREISPETRTILMSDYILSPTQLARADTGAIGFIPLPCQFGEIATFIRKKVSPMKTKEEKPLSTAVFSSTFDVLTARYSC